MLHGPLTLCSGNRCLSTAVHAASFLEASIIVDLSAASPFARVTIASFAAFTIAVPVEPSQRIEDPTYLVGAVRAGDPLRGSRHL